MRRRQTVSLSSGEKASHSTVFDPSLVVLPCLQNIPHDILLDNPLRLLLSSMGMDSGEDDACEPSSPLLKLPAELQIAIYSYALVEPTEITGTRREWVLHEAALLRTCRHIRKETTKTYFADNRFRLIFEDYDSSVYNALLKVLKSHGIETREHIKVSIRGNPNWDNLSQWRFLLSTYDCKAPERYEDYGQMEYASYDKLNMVFHYTQKGRGDMDWRAFQFPLQLFRIILATSDRRWLPADQTFRETRDLFIRTDLTAGLENMRKQIDRADPRIHRYRSQIME